MDLFSFLALLGGLAFFLYGMKVMSNGLESISSGKLNQSLKKFTKSKFLSMLFGIGLTVAVQSSSAVTVMLVGLVNSGILEFGQTIGIMMGSNIGTTLTAWILSLSGIESDSFFIRLLTPEGFTPIFALAGIILMMVSKKEKTNNIGQILLGFAVLMFGMNTMSTAMAPLAEMEEFSNLLVAFKNPLIAVLIGALFTGVIQSSAASVAILQALSLTGGVTYGMAIPLIMGQNIGTCVTALLSSIGVNKNAKKVAIVHLMFNIFGTLICLIPFCLGDLIFDWAFVDYSITPFMIAIVHSVFNVATTAILLPFSKYLEKIANKLIPDDEASKKEIVKLDDRLIKMPAVAIQNALEAVEDMCQLSSKSFISAMELIVDYDDKKAHTIKEDEMKLDEYQDCLGTYMMKLSKVAMSNDNAKASAKILHTIDDFERIGDHAITLINVVKEMKKSGSGFSSEAYFELSKVSEAIKEILRITKKSFYENNVDEAKNVEPLEQVIDSLIYQIRDNHISRLQDGECTMKLGIYLSDILTCFSRVSDHCSNIAVAVIESAHGSFDTHEYLHMVRQEDNDYFKNKFNEYSEIFSLKSEKI